ncbi:hypothetical protein LEP1GSC036_0922 [Leptospira weilii str. 2006001853]|uniref:Uncharacterized protein n=1 Tax=Leptospira weilii str. 2006001853 TaxID=1001589 RepID=A0A828YXV0_9LEPT|nr:hypothetical protein LEP1GSC036_0922 [Leptospira weilii str. 2006001853]
MDSVGFFFPFYILLWPITSLVVDASYDLSLYNRVSKILRLNAGFVLKLTVSYFMGISNGKRILFEI